MFPLNPDLARQLVGYRVDDQLREADHRRLIAEARRARRAQRRRPALPERQAAAPAAEAVPIPDVRIAQAQPSDSRALLAFLRELSPQTAYNRFVSYAAPVDVVDMHLMLVNDACHRAVLAFHGDRIVGHAHAVASAGGRSVELGVVVADEWQGRGIGPRLVRALVDTGPAVTADQLELLVLAWNRRARRMVEGLWPDAAAERDGELIHYRVQVVRAPRPVLVPGAAAIGPCGA